MKKILIATAWAFVLSSWASASDLTATSFSAVLANDGSPTSYSITLINNSPATSGAIRFEMWAFPQLYAGGSLNGYRTWTALGYWSDTHVIAGNGGIASGGVSGGSGGTCFMADSGHCDTPPQGTYYFAFVVTENDGAATNDGFSSRLYANFPNKPLTFGTPTPPPPAAITPQVGLWWNPTESGSGYAIDLQHGVVVVTIYSYNLDGTAEWYLMSGALSNNTVSGPLQKFRAGQCISCAYQAPVANGNDGTMTIVFTSATSATATLPGGRNFTIVTPSY